MTVIVVIDWTENAKSPGIPTVVVVKHSQPEEDRDAASRGGGVSWRFSQLTARATLETRGLRGFKASEKTGDFPV